MQEHCNVHSLELFCSASAVSEEQAGSMNGGAHWSDPFCKMSGDPNPLSLLVFAVVDLEVTEHGALTESMRRSIFAYSTRLPYEMRPVFQILPKYFRFGTHPFCPPPDLRQSSPLHRQTLLRIDPKVLDFWVTSSGLLEPEMVDFRNWWAWQDWARKWPLSRTSLRG